MNIVITGATGFVGRPLCAHLIGLGHRVTALSRDAARAGVTLGSQIESLEWGGGKDSSTDARASTIESSTAGRTWKTAVQESDAVIHLAGESVAGAKWTPEYKARIRASRVDSTKALVDTMRESDRRPGVLVSTSAIGYYGDRKDEDLTERSAPGDDFLAHVSIDWEAEARKAEALGVRVALMRVGIVLGPGGALEKMLHPLPLPINPYKLGAGGPLGNGRQWMSWVHLDDVIGLYTWALDNVQVSGPVNVTAPTPVTSTEFAHALGKIFHRPALIPVPAFALQALLGEFAASLLGSQRVHPEVAQRLGYKFHYPQLEAALRAALGK